MILPEYAPPGIVLNIDKPWNLASASSQLKSIAKSVTTSYFGSMITLPWRRIDDSASERRELPDTVTGKTPLPLPDHGNLRYASPPKDSTASKASSALNASTGKSGNDNARRMAIEVRL